MREGQPWPKISIITPSYNQGQFLEETIRSVLLQNYPNLEYIIMDGGSADNSVDIIKKYEPWLTYWVSEKDKGQADAIYHGFEKATGQIIAWINSDDYYLPNALRYVGQRFSARSDMEFLICSGVLVSSNGIVQKKIYAFQQDFISLLCGGEFFMQNACFWSRDAFFAVGGFDTALRFCFDYDLFLRLTYRHAPACSDRLVSAFRLHEESKTTNLWESVAVKEIAHLQASKGPLVNISEERRMEASKRTRINFHMNQRRGILKDFLRDPLYFYGMLRKKVLGFTGRG